jgi:DNA-binding CsgD family transcriptional regulator
VRGDTIPWSCGYRRPVEKGQRMKGKSQAQNPNEETLVHIFGPLKLQNELMCEFLERSTGVKCKCWEEPFPIISDIRTNRSPLILWDCVGTDSENLWTRFDTGVNSGSLLALFNVGPRLGISKELLDRGVRGIFFENESLCMFTKGVQAILNGELWFSRDTLVKCLLGIADSTELPQPKRPRLTTREKEILFEIASGSTNSKIADNLYISLHTVRTHMYNIFKKINVPNRLQAAYWASENLFNT